MAKPIHEFEREQLEKMSYGYDVNGAVGQRSLSSYVNDYEASNLQIGTSADGYDVKNTGGMFATVSTSVETIIKNRAGNSGTVSVYLATDGVSPIVLSAGESIIVDKFQVSNLFLDSDASFGALEYVDIILFG